jgi:hypothetical protein
MKTYTQLAIGVLALGFLSTAIAQGPADRPLPAQTPAPKGKQPAVKLQPIPEPPPPPPGLELDPSLEPQVTIRKRDREVIEEFRIRGRLYMIKVTPFHGVPYYLIDENGRGEFARRDSYDLGTRPPMWVIHTW